MSNQNNGGPAFPTEQGHIPDGTWNQTYESGISVRDYFAAKAIPAIIEKLCFEGIYREEVPGDSMSIAQAAYKIADAMLKERDK